MTTPTQAQAPPAQTGQQAADAALAVLVAEALVTAATVAAALSLLQRRFQLAGIATRALQGSLEVIFSFPPDRMGISGPATHATVTLNALRRAQYVVAAARRLTGQMAEARARGQSIAQALARGITDERRYYGQHLTAMWNRMQAAARTDTAVMQYGLLLGWNTVRDLRTSAECLLADGKNFLATSMPLIGYPGAVHPHCRCWPGRPHPDGAMLANVRMVA